MPPTMMTLPDARALRTGQGGPQGDHVHGPAASIAARAKDMKPRSSRTRVTTADFFPMFDVPFIYGAGWTAGRRRPATVIVLEQGNQPRRSSAARTASARRCAGRIDFRVVGVLDDWQPVRNSTISTTARSTARGAFVPFAGETLRARRTATPTAGRPRHDSFQDFLNSDASGCSSGSSSHGRERAPTRTSSTLPREQKARPLPAHAATTACTMSAWLAEVQQSRRRRQPRADRLAFGFLAVCLVNTVGLLLAKFLSGAGGRACGARSARAGARSSGSSWSRSGVVGARRRRARPAAGRRRPLGDARLYASLSTEARSRCHFDLRLSCSSSRSRSSPACSPACFPPGASGARRRPPTSSRSQEPHGLSAPSSRRSAQPDRRAAGRAADRARARDPRERECTSIVAAHREDRAADRARRAEHLLCRRAPASTKNYDSDARSREDMALLRSMPGASTHDDQQVPLSGGGARARLTGPTRRARRAGNYFEVDEHGLETLGVQLVEGPQLRRRRDRDQRRQIDPGQSAGDHRQRRRLADGDVPRRRRARQVVYDARASRSRIVGVIEHMHGLVGQLGQGRPHRASSRRCRPGASRTTSCARSPGERDALMTPVEAALRKRDPTRHRLAAQDVRLREAAATAGDRAMAVYPDGVTVLLLRSAALGIFGLAALQRDSARKQIGTRRAIGARRRRHRPVLPGRELADHDRGVVLGCVLALLPATGSSRSISCRGSSSIIWSAAGAVCGRSASRGLAPARRAAQVSPAMATRQMTVAATAAGNEASYA